MGWGDSQLVSNKLIYSCIKAVACAVSFFSRADSVFPRTLISRVRCAEILPKEPQQGVMPSERHSNASFISSIFFTSLIA